MKWHEDVRSVFEENKIAWINGDCKGGFGFKTGNGHPGKKLISILLPK